MCIFIRFVHFNKRKNKKTVSIKDDCCVKYYFSNKHLDIKQYIF